MKKEAFKIIPLALIEPCPRNPRDYFDPVQMQSLADSIQANGLVQPIRVRPVRGGFEVVAGHRRVRAHEMLGLTEIKAIVQELTEIEAYRQTIAENENRSDLTTMQKARQYGRLNELGVTQDQIRADFGEKKGRVKDLISFLRMPIEIQNAIDRGLQRNSARALSEIENANARNHALRRLWTDERRYLPERAALDLIKKDYLRPQRWAQVVEEIRRDDPNARFIESVEEADRLIEKGWFVHPGETPPRRLNLPPGTWGDLAAAFSFPRVAFPNSDGECVWLVDRWLIEDEARKIAEPESAESSGALDQGGFQVIKDVFDRVRAAATSGFSRDQAAELLQIALSGPGPMGVDARSLIPAGADPISVATAYLVARYVLGGGDAQAILAALDSP